MLLSFIFKIYLNTLITKQHHIALNDTVVLKLLEEYDTDFIIELATVFGEREN